MEKILFLLEVDEGIQKSLIARFPNEVFTFTNKTQVTKDEIDGATVIVGNPPVKLLSSDLAGLKWLQLNSAGFDEYLPEGVLPKQTILSNARGTYGLAVSEHAVAQCMMLMRKLHLYLRDQLSHNWVREGKIKSVFGSKVGIVGLGDIGRNIATRFHALGADVIGYDIHEDTQLDYLQEVRGMADIGSHVGDLDVLILCAPSTPSTYHMIDQEFLKGTKEDLILINVSRGDLVNTPELFAHMQDHPDFMAALDVIENEPLEKDSPYWDAYNLVLTPHVAGGFHLPRTKELFLEIATDNLERFLSGSEEVRNIIRR